MTVGGVVGVGEGMMDERIGGWEVEESVAGRVGEEKRG